jgi:hypothetical protein
MHERIAFHQMGIQGGGGPFSLLIEDRSESILITWGQKTGLHLSMAFGMYERDDPSQGIPSLVDTAHSASKNLAIS